MNHSEPKSHLPNRRCHLLRSSRSRLLRAKISSGRSMRFVLSKSASTAFWIFISMSLCSSSNRACRSVLQKMVRSQLSGQTLTLLHSSHLLANVATTKHFALSLPSFDSRCNHHRRSNSKEHEWQSSSQEYLTWFHANGHCRPRSFRSWWHGLLEFKTNRPMEP